MNQSITVYLASAVLSIILSGIIIPKILLIAFRKKLFDKPNGRKIHRGTVPRLGGFAFTPVVLFVMAFIIGVCGVCGFTAYDELTVFSTTSVCMGFCALLMMYLLGMADDLIGVRYRAKFAFETIASLMLMLGGLSITNLDGVLWIHSVPWWFGYPLTILSVIFVINSINLIDGIDGLASGLSTIAFVLYGIIFGIHGCYFYATLSFAVVGVLIPFFYYNVFGNAAKQKKIFMGDTGSLTIGILITFLGLNLWQMSNRSFEGSMPNYFIIIISPLIIPCFDVVRVFLYRIRCHNNPFMPDKNHIHHKLLASGMKQRAAMMTIVSVSLVICTANTLLSFALDVNAILLIDLIGLLGWNCYVNRRVRMHRAG